MSRNTPFDEWQEPVQSELDESGFLGRWSRRKAGLEPAEPQPQPPVSEPPAEEAAEPQPEARIDPRSGKPVDELTDEDMPPLESLDENADLSLFMGKKVSPALRMKALSRVFHSSKFNKVCLCAEYADDYTNFTPMGDIIPHDLKQAILREADKLRARLSERGLEISEEDAEARVAAEYRGEKLQDVEQLARETAEREITQAERECPERLQS